MAAEKKYWQINADRLIKDIKDFARKARTEEDLKMGIEPLLQNAFKQLGVDVEIVQYEKKAATRFKGKADAVYGYVTIEYKVPGKLSGKANAQKVSEQLQRKDTALLSAVYRHIKTLDDNGENGIWARYIKNAFAPVYIGKFDFVVGNPPWIRWGFLSDEYRKRTLKLWHGYGLFSLSGHETRLGAGEKDFSMLFTYACADNYLEDGGVLGFVITIEVFKSKGAGEGFRRFELKDKKTPLKMLGMEDMVDLKPFRGGQQDLHILSSEK